MTDDREKKLLDAERILEHGDTPRCPTCNGRTAPWGSAVLAFVCSSCTGLRLGSGSPLEVT